MNRNLLYRFRGDSNSARKRSHRLRSLMIAFGTAALLPLIALTVLRAQPAARLQQAAAGKPDAAPVGNAENGKQLFMRDGCYECHGILGQGSINFGPRLGPDPIPMQAIMNYIRKPAGNMPPFTAKLVSDQDVADIYAYLKSVPRPVDIKNIPLFK